jgi:hypothetical protein
MKTIKSKVSDHHLFQKAWLLLEADLEDPELEESARAVLKALRKRGYRPVAADLDDPECLACLHMALLSTLSMDTRRTSEETRLH